MADQLPDTLLDDVLREIASPPPVDVKTAVMAAWDDRRNGGRAADAAGSSRSRWPGLGSLRPVGALAAIAILLFGALLAWQVATRPPSLPAPSIAAGRPVPSEPAAPAAPQPAGTGTPGAQAEAAPAPGEHPPAASTRRRASRTVTVTFPMEEEASNSASAYLPGTPAGELGHPIDRMAGPPSIAIAPVTTAPIVSELARPVTDFPAEDEPPASETGQTEGEDR